MVPKHDGEVSWVKRVALIVLGVALSFGVVAGIVWLVFAAAPSPEEPRQTRIDPAEETSAAPLPSALPTSSTDATTPGGARPATRTPEPTLQRATRIAYRLGSTLYVADEDGGHPSPVARIAEGAYALSPDGRTVAAVDNGRLRLVDTATGAAVDAGQAFDVVPVWLPDSSHVLYLRLDGHISEVWRVRRDGTGEALVRQGGGVSVSPDGGVITVVEDGVVSTSAWVWVSRDGGDSFSRVKLGDGIVTAVAAGDDRVYAGVDGPGASGARIMSVRLDGGDRAQLAGAPAGDVPTIWGELCLSPDGSRLGAVAVGDDRYSRVSVISLASGIETRLSLRRDGYARCWSASGDYLYYTEGNAYQGEPTVLYRVAPDGSGRRVIATGAE